MNRITTRLKRYGCLLLCLCLLMPLLQGTAAAVQDSSVVRVAWYPDSAYNITCENGEHNVADVLDELAKAHVRAGRIWAEPPTLNDVFLEITGRELRD